MRRFMADLHVHTALSPCASRDMTPPEIVRAARARGLAMIAVCDHNSAGNAAAVLRAAGGTIAVIAGVEITTSEEVHVLGLFPTPEAAVRMSERVLESLPPWEPKRGATEAQRLLDEAGAIVGYERKMLAAASKLPLVEAVRLIREHGGLAVAAHLDRRAFSVLGQLGFLPEDVRFDALEVSAAGAARGRAQEFAGHGLPVVSSSDGHYPEDIGSSYAVLEAEQPCFAELVLAFQGQLGRRCGLA